MSELKNLVAIVLTYNEEIHIRRCITSLKSVADSVFVVDSHSTDRTVEIAEELGAVVASRAWTNYADQFQWGIDNCPVKADWCMRWDADEYLEDGLVEEINSNVPKLAQNVSGVYLNRVHKFLGRKILHGGRYPLKLLRIWRWGTGRIEQRWMDEHIVLSEGETVEFENDFVDDNLNNLSWFVEKHNNYATREMLDRLIRNHGLFPSDEQLLQFEDSQAKSKRALKEKIYNKLPILIGPLSYFLFRYFIQLGLLDGRAGLIYHVLQGFWYRALVDFKVWEAERVLSSVSDAEKVDTLSLLSGHDLRSYHNSGQ